MEKLSEVLSLLPSPVVKEPTPLGTFSTLAPEIRLQIYSLLFHRASPLRKAIRSYYEPVRQEEDMPATCRNLMDVAILQVSKAVSAEAMHVFYSTNKFHIEIPPGFPREYQTVVLDDVGSRGKRTVSWIFALPPQQACDYLKDLKISLQSCTLDESEDHDLSKCSVSAELVRRLQTPVVLRNTLTITLSRFQQARTPLMKAHFFQTLAKLTDFASIEIGVQGGFRRQSSLCMRYQSGAEIYNIYDAIEDDVAIGMIKEGFLSIWGPASVRREFGKCLVTFQPRGYLGGLRLQSGTSRVADEPLLPISGS